MTKTTITLVKSSAESPAISLTVHTQKGHDQALDDATIADLPAGLVPLLTSDELVRVIDAARLPLLPQHVGRNLLNLDRKDLERTAHLARRCSQGRLTASNGHLFASSATAAPSNASVSDR